MATGSRSVANHTTGVADRYLATRDVPNDDTACSDHRVFADSNPGADHAVTAYPYIASNVHGLRRFQAAAPGLRINRMQSGIDVHARTDLRILSNVDEVAVKEHTAKILKAARFQVTMLPGQKRSRSRTISLQTRTRFLSSNQAECACIARRHANVTHALVQWFRTVQAARRSIFCSLVLISMPSCLMSS